MSKIKALSENMIGKIAAGEVVERPAAAIKELVENSLDAGASAVTVEIREGGLEYIRVTDNGSGIDESDIRMAFERHATSKISKEQDLNAISTLGFRGEALASIAAVSRVTLTTRTNQNDTGLKAQNEGGVIISLEEAACPIGTTIVVRDLFYNVPVRKGFMKKAGQEAAIVNELILRLILSRPDVSFRFLSNGKTEYHSPGDGQMISALHTVYGGKATRSMRLVDDHCSGVIIQGYVGVGENARGNRNHELFFINGRIMQSKVLSESVERACRERVMIGKFPVCALQITIAYEAVDVNVHPNKLVVRFRDEDAVSQAVFLAVFEALKDNHAFEHPVEMKLLKETAYSEQTERSQSIHDHAHVAGNPIPSSNISVTMSDRLPPESAMKDEEAHPLDYEQGGYRPADEKGPSYIRKDTDDLAPGTDIHRYKPPFAEMISESHMLREESAEQVNTILSVMPKPIRIFGALFNTFILAEYEDQLMMIDQHAVHERLLFDRMMKRHDGETEVGQELLVPMIISVTNAEQRLLEDNRETLRGIGLVMESFGDHDMAVRTIPMILGETQTRDFITEVISELGNGKNPTAERKRTVILQAACKHAVKGGEQLTEDQIRDLLDTMIATGSVPTCPHGRPLVVSISHRELDRKFKRIQ